MVSELGENDLQSAHVNLGLDCVMIPNQIPAGSNAWRDGVDEWGQIWKNGIYVDGVVDTEMDLRRYSPPLDYVDEFFDIDRVKEVMELYPDHCLIYGSHIGPFTAGFMAMGFERFFLRLLEKPGFVHKLLEARTEWCIAMFRKATSLGVDVVVLGDDAGHKEGPMISPRMWTEFILPYHRRIVDELDLPVIWHSDGAIESLLLMAIEAGFVGVHGLEPAAGIDLGGVKREFGEDLVLIGNVDVTVLCDSDLDAVQREVTRCIEQGAPGGGYMISSCNSIFKGMNPASVVEMFRYAGEIGVYEEICSAAQ
ncbi:MAG: uroporphyrinogen decarboxylase family protein [Anaerolineae bacterium]